MLGFIRITIVLFGVLLGLMQYYVGFYQDYHSTVWGFIRIDVVLCWVLSGLPQYCLGFLYIVYYTTAVYSILYILHYSILIRYYSFVQIPEVNRVFPESAQANERGMFYTASSNSLSSYLHYTILYTLLYILYYILYNTYYYIIYLNTFILHYTIVSLTFYQSFTQVCSNSLQQYPPTKSNPLYTLAIPFSLLNWAVSGLHVIMASLPMQRQLNRSKSTID